MSWAERLNYVLYAIVGLLVLALVASLMTGCATSVPIQFNGGTDEAYRQDRYRCTQESRTNWGAGGDGWIGAGAIISTQAQAQQEANKLYAMCMEAKGYTRSCPAGYQLNPDRDKCKP